MLSIEMDQDESWLVPLKETSSDVELPLFFETRERVLRGLERVSTCLACLEFFLLLITLSFRALRIGWSGFAVVLACRLKIAATETVFLCDGMPSIARTTAIIALRHESPVCGMLCFNCDQAGFG